MVKFLSIDGAMRNWGLVEGVIENGIIKVQTTKHLHTAWRGKKPKNKNQNNHNLSNSKEIIKVAEQLRLRSRGKDVVFAELVGGGRSYAGATSLATAMGLICSINKPIVFVTPIEAKQATGNKSASKIQMIYWAVNKYPNLNWKLRKGKPTQTNEHIADSIAVAWAGSRKTGSSK